MNVRILREAGGLGDVVCTLPVARAVKETWPDAVVYYFGLEDYGDIVTHCPDVDRFVPVSMRERRPRDTKPDPEVYPYLAREGLPEFDMTIDCWCPAFRYEKERGPDIDRSRIESFCIAAGLTPSDFCPRYVVTSEERAWARGWMEGQGFLGRSVIGLQPFSRSRCRDWPVEKWASLIRALEKRRAVPLVFHTYLRKVMDLPGHKVTALPLANVAAILSQCDCVVAPDSGLFHLSAAVGTPAVGLFGSTSAEHTAKHYPRHTTLWPKHAPRDKRCTPPCHGFEWCGCDEGCRANGCEILAKIEVEDVLEAIATMRGRLSERNDRSA